MTQQTPAQWQADSTATFKSYAVLVIGDPSTTSSCSALTPVAGTTGSDAIGTNWQPAVSGNVTVLGTAPAAAGTSAATSLVVASADYAASGYSGGAGTGLYVSLNCQDKSAPAKTAVPLLSGVEGTGTAGGLTVKGGLSCSDAGTVNKWEAAAAGTFGAVTSSSLGTGSWTSTGCPVQEAFSSWPAMFTPVAFDAAADATADFTASDGVSGQPYVLLGHPVTAAAAAQAPGAGGEVTPLSAVGGTNPAAPGVDQATAADPVDTESGDFTQPATDFSIPGYGPALDFTRTYDAQLARQQTAAGKPGPLGYGWSDNWATSLTLQRPVPGDIYTVNTPGVYAYEPADVVSDAAGDLFYPDATVSNVVEVAAASHTQFGVAMTAGNAYVVAGSAAGTSGSSGDGGPATSALLNAPWSVTVDSSGNLFIADGGNNRIQEVPAQSGTQFGQAMTADHMYTVAGSATGASGSSGDGGAATAALLNNPVSIRADGAGNLYFADSQNFRVQEVPAVSGSQHGQSMTAGDMYTITGTAGQSSYSGDGGPAAAAKFVSPSDVALDKAGDLYVADDYANVVREIPAASGTQWGQAMTAGDIYPVAGNVSDAGSGGSSGDGGPATAALLNEPEGVTVDAAGDLYIADTSNNRIQEVPAASGTQWGQLMTAGDMYTIIGASMTQGDTGDGGPATAAEVNMPTAIAFDADGNLLIPDAVDSSFREVFATTSQLFSTSPAGPGITVNQADGSQVTFYPQSGGKCTAPYVTAAGSGYCTLPQNTSAGLTYSSGAGTYTYTPAPGTSYTYSSSTGALNSESDAAGNTLTVTPASPSPGSGNCPSAASSCTTIKAASGRSLVLGYSSGGLVTSVTDPMGRRWTYAYNTGSQLTSATDPMSHVTSYTYGAGSTGNTSLASDLLTITSPNAQSGGPDAGKATVNVYDSSGRVTTQTDPMGFKTTFNYCANAAAGDCMDPATGTGLVTVTDPDGNSTVYDYQQGALAAQSTFTGSSLTSEIDQQPNTTSGTLLDTTATDGNGNGTTTSYNNDGNPTSTTSPGANGTSDTTTNAYTAALQLDDCDSTAEAATTAACQQDSPPAPVAPGGTIIPPSSASPQGVTYTLYDTDGNELYATTGVYEPGATSAAYSQTTYQLFRSNSVTLNGNTVTCTAAPPSQSLPCARINADGVVTQLAYDSAGDLTSSSTPDGNGTQVATTTYADDADGDQTSTTSPDGNLSGANVGNYTGVTAYNADGQKTSVTQAGGSGATATPRVTSYGYDADGNQTTVKDARGYTTTTTYSADDKPSMVTDPDNDSALTCYDGDGHIAQTVPASGVAAASLTPASCPIAYPAGYSSRLAADATVSTFNALGDKTVQTTPAPAGQSGYETTTYTYDGNGNVLTTTAPPATTGGPSQVTTDTYNAAGQLASQTTGSGTSAASTVSDCYDPLGDTTSVVYADGNTSGTAPCETSSPWVISASSYPEQAGYQTTYGFDSAGELVSTTTPATTAAPSGATTTSTYDPAGNMLTSTDPDHITATYTYTPGNLTATVAYSGSAAHSVSYAYDANGATTGMTDATGTSSYTHDPFGELTSTTNGINQTLGYSYNADGTVAGITYPLPAAATWATGKTVSYGFDNADRLTSMTDFNGHQTTIGTTADGLPNTEALGSTGDTITTSYDPTNTASSIALKNSSSTLQSFSYSEAPSGNIATETDSPTSPSSPASYSYDAQGRATSMTPGSSAALHYTFDASGNLTTLPNGASGTYNHAGQLTSAALSGTTTSYAYNADGQRLTAAQGSTTTAAGTWNGADQLTAYNDSAANMTAATYDGNGLRTSSSATPSGGSAVTQHYTWDNDTLLMDSTNAYLYATGSAAPLEQVNLTSGTATYLVTDELGSVRGVVGASGALTGTTSYDAWGNPLTVGGLTSATPYGFAGGYTDPTGLVYLVHRYYDPVTGQFLSVDPDLSDTLEPYGYAAGDPVDVADPTGERVEPPPGGGNLLDQYDVSGYSCGAGMIREWCNLGDTAEVWEVNTF